MFYMLWISNFTSVTIPRYLTECPTTPNFFFVIFLFPAVAGDHEHFCSSVVNSLSAFTVAGLSIFWMFCSDKHSEGNFCDGKYEDQQHGLPQEEDLVPQSGSSSASFVIFDMTVWLQKFCLSLRRHFFIIVARSCLREVLTLTTIHFEFLLRDYHSAWMEFEGYIVSNWRNTSISHSKWGHPRSIWDCTNREKIGWESSSMV